MPAIIVFFLSLSRREKSSCQQQRQHAPAERHTQRKGLINASQRVFSHRESILWGVVRSERTEVFLVEGSFA
jgi:hypothetical protein